ncbi:hypothetical protein ACERII_19000 [Evansella sp. AB-rgal1]
MLNQQLYTELTKEFKDGLGRTLTLKELNLLKWVSESSLKDEITRVGNE